MAVAIVVAMAWSVWWFIPPQPLRSRAMPLERFRGYLMVGGQYPQVIDVRYFYWLELGQLIQADLETGDENDVSDQATALEQRFREEPLRDFEEFNSTGKLFSPDRSCFSTQRELPDESIRWELYDSVTEERIASRHADLQIRPATFTPDAQFIILPELNLSRLPNWLSDAANYVDKDCRFGWPIGRTVVINRKTGTVVRTVPGPSFFGFGPDAKSFWTFDTVHRNCDTVLLRQWSIHPPTPWWLWLLTATGIGWHAWPWLKGWRAGSVSDRRKPQSPGSQSLTAISGIDSSSGR